MAYETKSDTSAIDDVSLLTYMPRQQIDEVAFLSHMPRQHFDDVSLFTSYATSEKMVD